jgi:hypothetical protein
MPALYSGLSLRSSPEHSASPSLYLVQQAATDGPELTATSEPRLLAKLTCRFEITGNPFFALGEARLPVSTANKLAYCFAYVVQMRIRSLSTKETGESLLNGRDVTCNRTTWEERTVLSFTPQMNRSAPSNYLVISGFPSEDGALSR